MYEISKKKKNHRKSFINVKREKAFTGRDVESTFSFLDEDEIFCLKRRAFY